MKKISLNDKRKLIILTSLLLITGFLLTSLASYYVSKTTIIKSIINSELPITSDNIYSEIQKDIVRPVLISSLMARDTFLRDWVISGEKNIDMMTKYLKEIKTHYHTVTSFFVSDRSKIYYYTEGILKKVKEDEWRDKWYFRVRQMKEPYEINVDIDMANKDALTIFINYKVFDYNDNYIGVAGVGLTVDAVSNLIADYQRKYKRNIYFVNKDFKITLSGSKEHKIGSDIRHLTVLKILLKKSLVKKTDLISINLTGKIFEEKKLLINNKPITLTVSIGVGQYNNNETEENFINRIDKVLYQAKEKGKNIVYKAEDIYT